jgi:hypothetical protein
MKLMGPALRRGYIDEGECMVLEVVLALSSLSVAMPSTVSVASWWDAARARLVSDR